MLSWVVCLQSYYAVCSAGPGQIEVKATSPNQGRHVDMVTTPSDWGISSCVKWNICHCDVSWHILVLWLPQSARIWKEASLVSCSQNPAVSCPLCKLPVNEWAGHLAPWGSTSGSSDHQLLCLRLSHAPVSMMNPEHECKALTSPYVSSSSFPASNRKQVWGTAVEHWYKLLGVFGSVHFLGHNTAGHTNKMWWYLEVSYLHFITLQNMKFKAT